MSNICDKKPSPEWLQDLIIKAYIDKLLYRDEVDSTRYSLDTPKYNSLPKAKAMKESKLLQARKTAKDLGKRYVARLLESKGYDVAVIQPESGYDVLAVSADCSMGMKLNVLVEQNIHSPVIAIETGADYPDENRSIGIDDTLADYYMIKICGVPGAYQVATNELRRLLKDNCINEAKLSSGNRCHTVAILNRKLLLDNAIHIV